MTDSIQVIPNAGHPTSNAIEQVFLDQFDLVYRTAYRVTGNATDAEDVLQTVFGRLVKKVPVTVHAGWPAYLRRAAVNVSLDVVRSGSSPGTDSCGDLACHVSRQAFGCGPDEIPALFAHPAYHST